eukprot:TRINITY_DN15405_c0_g1_i1.p1 TRINITY_DN15405_c0_g1~~TRINITY_DN15405_c0_g1_i1.p1  ORF type:complete len:388 (+),score=99.38 TRINITY_DN15405_c0_g1_i1:40-1203(+)
MTEKNFNLNDSDDEETLELTKEQIDENKLIIWGQNKYKLVQTDTRNVMLCGRTRSGKTTAINLLKDPCFNPSKYSLFSETKDPKFQSFAIQTEEDNSRKFTINVIDTPGLFEVKTEHELDQVRTNKDIQNVITKCLENEITNIHVLLVFVAFEQGINPHDIDAMKIFLKLFGGNKVKIALCISRADNHNKVWRNEMKEQLNQHKEISEMIKKENVEIKFVGCVDMSSGKYNNQKEILTGFKSAYMMRKELLEFIFSAKERVQLIELNVAQESMKRVSDGLHTLIKNFGYFSSLDGDFSTEQAQKTLVEHHKILNEVYSGKTYISFPALNDAMSQLSSSALFLNKVLPETVNEETRKKIFDPLLSKDMMKKYNNLLIISNNYLFFKKN